MTSGKKVLILGGSSFVGKHLFAAMGTERSIATYNNTPIPNGVHFDSLTMSLADVLDNPEAISHAVILFGDTEPDSCASDIPKSNALNVGSIKRVIDYLNQWKIKPIFTSTESIFDGVRGNYDESDPPNPILTYGHQKVEVERYLQSCCPSYAIIRLPKMFGSERGDGTLFTSWLDAIERSEVIHCAEDQIFSPIHVGDVVKSLIRSTEIDCQGIYHLSNPNAYSRLQLLNILLSHVAEYSSLDTEVVPCSIHDFDLVEKRPVNTSMNPAKWIRLTGLQITPIDDVCRILASAAFQHQVKA